MCSSSGICIEVYGISIMGIKVEGHSHLVRDEESHAIINTDVEQYRLTMRRREMLRTQRDEINSLKEDIIATSATVEGKTTAHYIEDSIKNDKLKITKLAQGLPVGGEIEQLDDGTLFSAFKNRVPVTND